MAEEDNLPRSKMSTVKVYLRFVNRTNRRIEIIWINYNGEQVRYILLKHDTFVDLNTFETHPWMALDVQTKDRMWINNGFLYLPQQKSSDINDGNLTLPVRPVALRQIVHITLPVYNLRVRCLLEIRNYLKEEREVDSLTLPKELVKDLKDLLIRRVSHSMWDLII